VTPRREEPAPAKREERAAPPLNLKREERPPILAAPPKREERIPGPTLVSKREEPPAPPAVKRDERPGLVPASVKREERPQVTLKREEPAPAKPGEKPVGAKPAESVAPAAKKEEAALKSGPDEFAKSLAPLVAAAGAQPEPVPGLFSRLKWVILAIVIIGLTAGAWFTYQGLKTPVREAARQSDSLSLKVDRNAGQYILSWDRNSTLIATATRATLSIMDGDHKEDVDLDLSQLRTGNIVYSPMTNDVSFALEVTDLKHGKSIKESTRVLGARPSPTLAAIPPSAAKPAPVVPDKLTAVPPPPPAPRTQTPPEQPKAVAGPAVTAAPPKPESLAARLRAAEPQEMPAPPTLESSSNALAGSAPVTTIPQVAPPTAQMPAAPPKPAPARAQPVPPPAPAVPARGGQVHEARLIKRIAPNYPNLARQEHISGVVRLLATVGKDGRVKKTSVLSGPPLLRQAATEAVQHWLYSPALLDGEPVEVETQVDVSFTM
jgi:protein TonB